MAETGCPVPIIAQRLGYTERHVYRLLAALEITIEPADAIGTEDEWMLWEVYRELRESYRRIAARFGVSHETIRNHFDQPRQVVEPW